VDLLPFPHDLPDLCNQKYGYEAGMKIYAELRMLFDRLYSAVIIGGQAVLIHGGVPSMARSAEDLAYAHRRHPKQTHLEEMLWNDPQEGLSGTKPSPRGARKLFGANITEQFLQMLKVNVLIRGHESCPEGCRIGHGGKILTLFSTNKGAYGNRHAAYLQLNLSEGIGSAEQLKRHVKQF
jgi:serine/threonine-protein phosphatase 5